MRYVVYASALIATASVALLWVRLLWNWKHEGVVRYAKLGVVMLLSLWVAFFDARINRYRKINNLRDAQAPIIEFAVQHALQQKGTSAEEKKEMERQLREGIDRMIEWQVDHE